MSSNRKDMKWAYLSKEKNSDEKNSGTTEIHLYFKDVLIFLLIAAVVYAFAIFFNQPDLKFAVEIVVVGTAVLNIGLWIYKIISDLL